MRIRRANLVLALLTGAATASAGTLQLQFMGGSMHDPDGPSYGVGSAQTGFYELTISASGEYGGGDLRDGASFLTFRMDIGPGIVAGEHTFTMASTMSMPNAESTIPLSSEVAFLYSQFRSGALSSLLGFDSGSDADLDALQDAIWHFQGLLQVSASQQLTNTDPLDDEQGPAMSARAQEFIAAANAAIASGDWSGTGDVMVLTTLPIDGDESTMGNYLTVATPIVPLPAPVGFALGGLLIVGARRRRSL